MRALQIAATGMAAQQTRVEVISQNLANMSTTGYNARRAEFADLAYQQVTRPGTIAAADGTMVPAGVQMGLGVRPTAVTLTLAQGALAQTGGDLDLAIDGPGYLEVTMPSGMSGYTRDGGLKRSADGLIVTSDGFPVAPGITVPAEARSLSISAAGEVFAHFENQIEPQNLGQITLASFVNEKGWRRSGRTSSWKPPPRARRWSACRASRVWGRSGRDTWKKARSIRCARSRSSSRRSGATS